MDHWLDIAEDTSEQIIDQWQSLSIQLGHRITLLFNGTEFTDYFELSEQQELINHGEDIFSNWHDHDRQIHDKNVNILNA